MADIEFCRHGDWVQNCKECRELRKQSLPKFKGASRSGKKTPENSDTYFGHSWPEWFAMRDAGIAIIEERGAQGSTITYPELWEAIAGRLGRHLESVQYEVPALLEGIDEESGMDARFLLTALVVDGYTAIPSEGFFRLAERRNLLAPGDTPPPGQAGRRSLSPAQRKFWEDQVAGVFAILRT